MVKSKTSQTRSHGLSIRKGFLTSIYRFICQKIAKNFYYWNRVAKEKRLENSGQVNKQATADRPVSFQLRFIRTLQ